MALNEKKRKKIIVNANIFIGLDMDFEMSFNRNQRMFPIIDRIIIYC